MTITFFSNFLNHHQLPLCQEFIQIVGESNFRFVATDKLPEERRFLGYEDLNETFPFVVKEYNKGAYLDESHRLAKESDIAIFTPSAFPFCEERMKENMISFLYIERQFKRGLGSLLHPRVFKRYFGYQKYRKNNLYVLCAGASVASDLAIFGFPKDKCFKWGYFPVVKDVDIQSILDAKDKNVFRMMWCARFINWKRPELAIRLARDLKKNGYNVTLDMYGNGKLMEKMHHLVDTWDVEDVVTIHGSVNNDTVLNAMRSHHVFLFTSNKREGWGAVSNEAMANGCTLVASNDIGAVPYLVEDGNNGIIFDTNSYHDLYNKVVNLIINPNICKQYAMNSYVKIHNLWNAKNAAENFIRLYNSILKRIPVDIEMGPCSKA